MKLTCKINRSEFSFRRKDQLNEDVIWSVFEKVVQSNARFNALHKLVVVVHSVAMPVGFGRVAVKTKGRQLAAMAHLKRSIVEVRAEENCLAHALIIAIARFNKDRNYDSYRHGSRIIPVVNHLLHKTGIDLTNGGGIRELSQFQDHFKDYRIVVYGGLNCEDMIFDGQSQSEKRIYLLYDETTRHYHVITNLTGAMASGTSAKAAVKDVRETELTSAMSHVAIACLRHHASRRRWRFESRASPVTAHSEVRRVSTGTRRIS